MADPQRTTRVTTDRSNGIGILGLAVLATIIFGVLKRAEVLDITWLTVFSPILVIAGLTGVALLVLLVVLAVGATVVALSERRKR